MIDIHCHILPGVDDGSKDLTESLEMAMIAQGEGIKQIINTSHYRRDFDFETGEILLEKLNSFNKLLKEKNIDIEVFIGNEIYYSEDILEYIDNKEFYTLNNSRYLLIEFSPMRFPNNLCDIIYELKIRGYIPILAHVERYAEIQANPNIIYDCIKEGALIQVGSTSVLGRGSKEGNKLCSILLNYNMIHFIATDAHSSNRRKPIMKEAYDYVMSKYGEDMANSLFRENAGKVLKNEVFEGIDKLEKYNPKNNFFKKLFKLK
ncbi:MAG: CpsB/CapC family capsule biosynthesis tyrosine phosphatase [Bacilli bacterium]